MAHKHEHLMKILAQQILHDVEKIGELWEYKITEDAEWHEVNKTLIPSFNPIYEYRLKPKSIMINGFEVPEPERVAPKLGTAFYVPLPSSDDTGFEWTGNKNDLKALENGTVHLTPEAAELHSKAIYSFTRVQAELDVGESNG